MPRLLCALSVVSSIACGAGRVATRPVNARLAMAPRQAQHCVLNLGNKDAYCAVLKHARAAFTEATAGLSTPGAADALRLVLTVENALVYEQARGGLWFDVRVNVRVESPDGALLDTIQSAGYATLLDSRMLEGASIEATRAAARDFERQYARSSAVAGYLAAR